MPAPPSDPEVCVWHGHVDVLRQSPSAMAQGVAWLTEAERVRHARFRKDLDREMFLLGRVMARAIVADALSMAPTAWPWREGPHGRPEIDIPGCPVTFNIAHSGGLVACAISWHGEVGVDIEDRRRAPIDRDMVARFMSAAEAVDVNARGPDGWRDRFLQYWTLKESYLKARGLGIAVHLSDLGFSLHGDTVRLLPRGSLTNLDDAWAFELITLHADHYLAVAAPLVDGDRPRFRFEPFPAVWLP